MYIYHNIYTKGDLAVIATCYMYLYKSVSCRSRGTSGVLTLSIMANRWPHVSKSADILDWDIKGPKRGPPNPSTQSKRDCPRWIVPVPPPGTPERGLPSNLKRQREHQDCSLVCTNKLWQYFNVHMSQKTIIIISQYTICWFSYETVLFHQNIMPPVFV